MAEVLPEYDFKHGGPRGGSRWDEFLDGQIRRLVENEDYTRIGSARKGLYERAKRRGLKVRTQVEDGALVVQACSPNGASE